MIGGGTIDVRVDPGVSVPTDQIKEWVRRAGVAVNGFYGRYPVRQVTVTVSAAHSGRIENGFETSGKEIDIDLGPRTRQADLTDDWMMTHEMFHLSQPNVRGGYSYMSEGMADYLEPVARVEAGQITVERFWKDLVEGLPQGLPRPGENGLDRTHTWASTYWGGCLFWFVADVRIHQQTRNQKSIRDAAAAALGSGGNGSQVWPLDRLLATYDRGTGTTVFQNLHEELGLKAGTIDLPAMWESLGVIYRDGKVTFDDSAPLAEVRKAMTAAPEK